MAEVTRELLERDLARSRKALKIARRKLWDMTQAAQAAHDWLADAPSGTMQREIADELEVALCKAAK